MYKPNIDSMFRPSQSLFSIGYSVHNKQYVTAAVERFNRHDKHTYYSNNRIPLTRSNSILTKSSGSRKPDELVEKGLPNADQLNHVYTRLGEDVSLSIALFLLKLLLLIYVLKEIYVLSYYSYL
jgi:hypothetical protein